MPDSDALTRMLDVPLDIEVGLEGPTLTLSQILAMRVGTVIATQNKVGEEMNVFASSTRIGSGEMAVVQNRVAVRMTRFTGRR